MAEDFATLMAPEGAPLPRLQAKCSNRDSARCSIPDATAYLLQIMTQAQMRDLGLIENDRLAASPDNARRRSPPQATRAGLVQQVQADHPSQSRGSARAQA